MRYLAAVLSLLLAPSFLLAQSSGQKIGASASPINVLTYHNDNGRTGQMPLETILTPANVNSANFGKLYFLPTDGRVGGETLYASNVSIGGVIHNVIYVVTEHDTIYAFDADTGAHLWQTTALLQGETPALEPNDCFPTEIGITNTPVIDRTKGPNGAIYFVAMSTSGNNVYYHRLHALDLATGAELFGGPNEIDAKYPGTGDGSRNGFVVFDPGKYAQRAGLLEISGNIYLAFTSQCDSRPYTGWVMEYSASTLAQISVLNVTPNGRRGAIWQAGAGPAADSDGYIYFIDANGDFDTTLDGNGFPINGDYGNAMVKLSTSPLAVADYFTMYNTVQLSQADLDFGSGGALVLPDVSVAANKKVHLVVGAGKDHNIYVANRDNMGKWNPNDNSNVYQELPSALANGEFAMPAYFNNTVYFGGTSDYIKAFPIVNGKLASPSSQTNHILYYPGVTPSISSNAGRDSILWAVECTNPRIAKSAVLYAYNALDLTQMLYSSNQAGARDEPGVGNKWIIPMIANGRVYVGTQSGVAVYGLLH